MINPRVSIGHAFSKKEMHTTPISRRFPRRWPPQIGIGFSSFGNHAIGFIDLRANDIAKEATRRISVVALANDAISPMLTGNKHALPAPCVHTPVSMLVCTLKLCGHLISAAWYARFIGKYDLFLIILRE